MYYKKSQMTIFIIIAIIIVIVGVLSFFLMLDNDKEILDNSIASVSSGDDLMFSNVKDYFNDCFENKLVKSVRDIQIIGGYYNDTSYQGLNYYNIHIPYYFNGTDSLIPDIETIKTQLSYSMENNVLKCVEEYNSTEWFADLRTNNKSNINLIFNADNIEMDLKYSMTLKLDDEEKSYSDFTGSNINLIDDYLEISSEIVELHKETPDNIPISGISNLSRNYKFNYEIIKVPEKDSAIFTILLSKSNSNSIFVFAIKYLDESVNNSIINDFSSIDSLEFSNSVKDEGFLG